MTSVITNDCLISDTFVAEIKQSLVTTHVVWMHGIFFVSLIQRYFSLQDQDHIRTRELNKDSKIPKPFHREYILRTTVSKPSPNSRPSPQRLYTSMTNKGFRMAGSFTEDTNFL